MYDFTINILHDCMKIQSYAPPLKVLKMLSDGVCILKGSFFFWCIGFLLVCSNLSEDRSINMKYLLSLSGTVRTERKSAVLTGCLPCGYIFSGEEEDTLVQGGGGAPSGLYTSEKVLSWTGRSPEPSKLQSLERLVPCHSEHPIKKCQEKVQKADLILPLTGFPPYSP